MTFRVFNFPSILSPPHFCWLGPCQPFRGAADRSRQEPTEFLLAWPVSPLKLLPGAWCLVPARPRLGPVTRARAELGAGSQPRLLDSAFTQHSPASTTQ